MWGPRIGPRFRGSSTGATLMQCAHDCRPATVVPGVAKDGVPRRTRRNRRFSLVPNSFGGTETSATVHHLPGRSAAGGPRPSWLSCPHPFDRARCTHGWRSTHVIRPPAKRPMSPELKPGHAFRPATRRGAWISAARTLEAVFFRPGKPRPGARMTTSATPHCVTTDPQVRDRMRLHLTPRGRIIDAARASPPSARFSAARHERDHRPPRIKQPGLLNDAVAPCLKQIDGSRVAAWLSHRSRRASPPPAGRSWIDQMNCVVAREGDPKT